ncbi:hypothetical protein ACTU6U_06105 [Microbacterium sp. A196]|uniref:hypothetical protein n=1 Tax=Microbacterium sp. A196 TaxID=3457320 RepID=UPI003FD315F3
MTTKPDAFTFASETVDYPELAALRRYPAALTADGTDTNAAARAAYAAGLADGLAAATP